MKPNLRQAAVIAAIALLALAWPILPAAVLGLLGFALAHPTLTALGLLAYAYPSHTKHAAKRTAKTISIGAMITVHAIRPKRTTPAPKPATA